MILSTETETRDRANEVNLLLESLHKDLFNNNVMDVKGSY
jgi:hypothetical protein